jgi:hypothetical protein
MHFTWQFKYLGSFISPEMNEDAEIAYHIKKAKSLMEMVYHFFSCRDVDIQTKHNIYIAFLLNALLWGCKTCLHLIILQKLKPSTIEQQEES